MKHIKTPHIINREGTGNRGVAHGQLNHWPEVKEIFDRAIAIKPVAEGYFSKGLACFNLNLFKETVDALSKAIDLNYKDENCWYLRGRSYENLGIKEQLSQILNTF